jgi:hypothetical protein
VTDRRGGLAEGIAAVDGGSDRTGLDELPQRSQVIGVLRGHEGAEFLADERGQQLRPELPVGAAQPPSAAADRDV